MTDLESLKAHILTFVTAYNFAKHLKALRWRTPFQAICDAWTKDPSIFRINPHHLMPGPYMEQWHNELDPAFGERMGDYYRAFVTEEARALGVTLEDLRAWRPVAVAAKRGRKKKV